MKPIDYLLLAAVILLVLLALRVARSRRKNGCCGGGSCSCGGNCAGCSGCNRTAGKGTSKNRKEAASEWAPMPSACPHCTSQTSYLKE